MSKEELLTLIDEDKFDKAFDELNAHFKNGNDMLALLIKEFIVHSGSFNEVDFKQRLRSFIGISYIKKANQKPHIEFYDVLCELDFKLQTENFTRVYKHKKIAPFLLHGETDDKGSDIKWLYNQLLSKEGLTEKSLVIDLKSPLGSSPERLKQEFYSWFQIDAQQQDSELGLIRNIEARLKTGPFVCIIQNAEGILDDSDALQKLFSGFLVELNKQIYREGHTNPLIFLFVEHKLTDTAAKDGKYFFWYDQQERNVYPLNAVACKDLKIIDLGPVEKITENDITNWIMWSMQTNPDIYDKTKCLHGKECNVLQAGTYPQQVIRTICDDLKIDFNELWIK